MKTIWKFKFEINDNFELSMPKNAEILTIQIQNNIPCIWAIIDSDQLSEIRYFELYGTGHLLKESKKKYIGSFRMYNDSLIFHLFENI